jgi:S1-C subfamily serine protease
MGPPIRGSRMSRVRLVLTVGALLLVAVVAGFGVGHSTASRSVNPPVAPAIVPAAARASTASAASRTPAQIAAAAVPGVVSITSSTSVGVQGSVASGSGFVVDRQGRIVTNQHVVNGASTVYVSFADGTKARARVLAEDPLLDLAVIRVDVPARVLRPLPLGSSDRLRLGDPLVAIGNPFGLDRSVSVGVVSGLRRQIQAPNGFTLSNAVQTDAAINHGNSGGPLIDGRGRVIGVNAQIAESGVNANVGVGFAIAINASVKRAIASMAQGKAVTHAWLGVSVDEVDAVLATSGLVTVSSGVILTGIVPGGPAATAGLRGGTGTRQVDGVTYCLGGDIVTRVGAVRVATSGELQTAIAAHTPGTTVEFTVVRPGGATSRVPVRLGSQPTSAPRGSSACG